MSESCGWHCSTLENFFSSLFLRGCCAFSARKGVRLRSYFSKAGQAGGQGEREADLAGGQRLKWWKREQS